jgi:hypothetical protein
MGLLDRAASLSSWSTGRDTVTPAARHAGPVEASLKQSRDLSTASVTTTGAGLRD